MEYKVIKCPYPNCNYILSYFTRKNINLDLEQYLKGSCPLCGRDISNYKILDCVVSQELKQTVEEINKSKNFNPIKCIDCQKILYYLPPNTMRAPIFKCSYCQASQCEITKSSTTGTLVRIEDKQYGLIMDSDKNTTKNMNDCKNWFSTVRSEDNISTLKVNTRRECIKQILKNHENKWLDKTQIIDIVIKELPEEYKDVKRETIRDDINAIKDAENSKNHPDYSDYY